MNSFTYKYHKTFVGTTKRQWEISSWEKIKSSHLLNIHIVTT